MNIWIRPNTNRKSNHVFGEDAATKNAMTEAAEFIHALGKLDEIKKQGRTEEIQHATDHLAEEMADCIIGIVNMMELHNIDRFQLNRWLNIKQDRQEKRIEDKLNGY